MTAKPDIVERLNGWSLPGHDGFVRMQAADVREAAVTISSQRKTIERMREEIEKALREDFRIAAITLRAALSSIGKEGE